MLKELYQFFIINRCGLFDRAYYLLNNPDVRKADIDPLWHFIIFGWKENRNPSIKFNTGNYLIANPDVERAKINPLIHYIKFGISENRIPDSNNNPSACVVEVDCAASIQGYATQQVEINLDKTTYEQQRFNIYKIIPHYLNPFHQVSSNLEKVSSRNIAVHVHFFEVNGQELIINLIKNIPLAYDVFITSSVGLDKTIIKNINRLLAKETNKIKIVENQLFNNDLIPILTCLSEELINYEYICHVHNQPTENAQDMTQTLKEMIGSKEIIDQILQLLMDDAKFVYPAPEQIHDFLYNNGWDTYFDRANYLFHSLFGVEINHLSAVEFPNNSIFWARVEALKPFFLNNDNLLRLKQEDKSPDLFSGALKRLLLIPSIKQVGNVYRIYTKQPSMSKNYYECQQDYSNSIEYKDIKVLAYYLPQFIPIPENDEWHGKGFTEWHKVRSANPLFYGHYQQRKPHDDIGYYSLATTETLKNQANLMEKAGVHGLIFYHYWFDGKLILEKPAQLLLEDKTIKIPFCFCWANENWTRKWDGNEEDILLGQNYSSKDAENFINYLIPFLKDKRYIKIDDRPVIFIYRPASFPEFNIYKNVWRNVCNDNNIKEPYIVGVLTRGAMSPIKFDMDAGCERVLHDWGDGDLKAINTNLNKFRQIHKDVLDYDDVVNYYLGKLPERNFTHFRSLVPSWDNTPRYGENAYIVHNSSPEKFQEWLEQLIIDASLRLPKNLRFIPINAWNEWAESAYLEPDQIFGYAYLNAIGRALSNIPYKKREYLNQSIPEHLNITIQFDDVLLQQLQKCDKSRKKIIKCLKESTIFSLCNIYFYQTGFIQWLSDDNLNIKPPDEHGESSDFTFRFKDLCFFPPETLENMVKMALFFNAELINPTHVNDEKFTHANLGPRWEVQKPSEYLCLIKNEGINSIKCCVDAKIFISKPESTTINQPNVTTIIRFCENDSLDLLKNALYSLIAQIDCNVRPYLAVKINTDIFENKLKNILNQMPWDFPNKPIIKVFKSEHHRDIRSMMLNKSLTEVETKYVSFLDYDDTLFHDAYAWLIHRLSLTGKNASFGLVYDLSYNSEEKLMNNRSSHSYGKNYDDFLDNNLTPIHGFMLDAEKIELKKISFYDNMKFMEDYYLTLQVFTKSDTDWASLDKNMFIGDYYLCVDITQTVGNLNEHERRMVVKSIEYLQCQERITLLRNHLKNKSLSISL